MSGVSFTIFKSKYDNKTDKLMSLSNFEEFEALLYKLSQIPVESKKKSYLISPAQYLADTNRRCNVNVSHWSSWAAMDVDDHNFSAENLENELAARFSHYNYVCYSTASSSWAHPKFRMVFPLSGNVEGPSIRDFWYALNCEIESLGDPQTKDLSRMYYVPASYAGAYNFIFSNHTGRVVDADALIASHPVPRKASEKSFIDRLPEKVQKEVIEHRKSSFKSRNPNGVYVTWTSYRDCPFVNQKLVQDYKDIAFVDNSGRYALIYKLMVSISVAAIRAGYPITPNEVASLIRELDTDTSNRYGSRPLEKEADRAIEYAYRKM